jgi:ferredoxin-NADP reductase
MSLDEAASRLDWQEAVIEAIAPLTPRIKSFLFRAPLAAPVAGQHVDVRLTAPDGYRTERSYSIASAPESPLLELAVERLDDGEVSGFFHDVAEVGDAIELRGPIGGHFVWRDSDGGPLLLIAGGSGIAPLMAMLRHRAQAGSKAETLLLYSGRTLESLAFLDELLAMETGDPHFHMVLAITRGAASRATDYARRLDRAALEESLRRWGHRPRLVFVCGSNGFVEAMTSGLVGLGVAPGLIRAERFGGTP